MRLVLCLLLLTILQLSHILSLFQLVALLAHLLNGSPCMPAVVFITVLFKVLYCKMKNVLFFFGFDFYVKSITNLLQYSTI